MVVTVGVLALQGGFSEHLDSLRKASVHDAALSASAADPGFDFVEVRTPEQLAKCYALIIPGGESTTLSLVAAQSGLLQPLRDFVKVSKKPTWGTCAGLILLCEAASSTKRGGQELIGGLDVRVHRNHFGRQIESFVTDLELPFLASSQTGPTREDPAVFPAVFIRAPVVDALLTGEVRSIDRKAYGLCLPEPAPGGRTQGSERPVEILAILPGRHASNEKAMVGDGAPMSQKGTGDIVALQQGNVFGTSFHPELTDDIRIHEWWLNEVVKAYRSQS